MKKNIVLMLTVGIICLSILSVSAKELFATLDSLSGKAEIQRAGQQKWVLVDKYTKLYNNDIIRVLEKSTARIKWQNGSTIYVNSNSQILINLHSDTINNKLSNYATVFFGAIYFIVKKSLPKAISKSYDTKVYTPTAVIAIRGTSFMVTVKKENGDTRIGVLNGTVLVKNILKSQSIFLAAAHQTDVTINTDPITPSAFLKKDIEKLKTWVPPQVIIDEMNLQIARAKRDYLTITGKLENKIVVLPFNNKTGYKGKWQIEENIASSLAERIKVTSRINSSSIPMPKKETDPIAIGLKNNVRFVITGDIKRFEIVKKAEITAAADKYRELCIANICIEFQLIDVERRTLVYKNEVCGEVSGKNNKGNNWQHINTLSFNLKDAAFSSSIMGKALNQMLEQSSSHLSRYLEAK